MQRNTHQEITVFNLFLKFLITSYSLECNTQYTIWQLILFFMNIKLFKLKKFSGMIGDNEI